MNKQTPEDRNADPEAIRRAFAKAQNQPDWPDGDTDRDRESARRIAHGNLDAPVFGGGARPVEPSGLPAHEDGPSEVPSPWAAAAKAFRLRLGAASLRVDSAMSRLPTPGCTDSEDMLALEQFAYALELAAGNGERLLQRREERRQAERRARQLERAADALKV